MKINSYQIGMDSAGTYRSTQTRKYSITLSREDGRGKGAFAGLFGDAFAGSDGSYSLTGNDANETTNQKEDSADTSLMDRFVSSSSGINNRISEVDHNDTLKSIDQVRQRFVLYLWRMFFGQDRAEELAERVGIQDTGSTGLGTYSSSDRPFSVIKIEGVQETYFEESQELSFTSKGNVTTADGRSIDFNLDISMSSSFSHYYREEFQGATAMCDPLVLNFEGEVADLTDTKFYFDLDCDGTEDEISTLASGNGFLALDNNGDGIINDGSELFGTRTGNGFGDLARFDSDGNGWIDENDDIYDRLKIWIKDAQGNDTLYSLKDKNVGAIYLGNVDTGFGIRSNTTGHLNGAIRRTGLFLYEDGTGVGTMSHLDIAN